MGRAYTHRRRSAHSRQLSCKQQVPIKACGPYASGPKTAVKRLYRTFFFLQKAVVIGPERFKVSDVKPNFVDTHPRNPIYTLKFVSSESAGVVLDAGPERFGFRSFEVSGK